MRGRGASGISAPSPPSRRHFVVHTARRRIERGLRNAGAPHCTPRARPSFLLLLPVALRSRHERAGKCHDDRDAVEGISEGRRRAARVGASAERGRAHPHAIFPAPDRPPFRHVMSLAGKVALVTGSTQGIGAGMLRALAGAGAGERGVAVVGWAPCRPLVAEWWSAARRRRGATLSRATPFFLLPLQTS
jgi:hypothetical protein